ncbi:MAG: hypothetical protein JXJ22_11460 [Bacteroidales bacterium]|nr:hypothetical protein [Bacteroidales bacterium]
MNGNEYIGRGCKMLDKSGELTCNCGCHKLESFNWLQDITESSTTTDMVEVRFKNTRKAYFKNTNKIRLHIGDIVAVEANPGHDIGIVSLIGELVEYQMKRNNIEINDLEAKKIYRKAKSVDIDKWKEAIGNENGTMLKARKISEELGLNMKIGDVEYQGDNTKAIFYYIADDRVDFRELIKVLADRFKVRIEMKQIGARQEAGRIGGVGSCGRELCCSTFITNFVSVTTNSARYQEVSLNPQKLAGQCGKLKCCLNYELDAYLDAQLDFPDISIPLETKKGNAYHQKTDVFKRLMWYSFEKDHAVNLTCMSVDTVKEVIQQNKNGEVVENLKGIEESAIASMIDYQNALDEEDNLSRFADPVEPRRRDNKKRKKFRKPNKNAN